MASVLRKRAGRFVLTVRMTKEGYLHLSYYSRDEGKSLGEVYFGQGDNVYR